MSDPKTDPERMKKWEANALPVPSAERLKGKGSSPSPCSAWMLGELESLRNGIKQALDEMLPKLDEKPRKRSISRLAGFSNMINL